MSLLQQLIKILSNSQIRKNVFIVKISQIEIELETIYWVELYIKLGSSLRK